MTTTSVESAIADQHEHRKWEPRRIIRVTVRSCGIGISREFVIDETVEYSAATKNNIDDFVRKVRRPGVEVNIEDFTRTDTVNL